MPNQCCRWRTPRQVPRLEKIGNSLQQSGLTFALPRLRGKWIKDQNKYMSIDSRRLRWMTKTLKNPKLKWSGATLLQTQTRPQPLGNFFPSVTWYGAGITKVENTDFCVLVHQVWQKKLLSLLSPNELLILQSWYLTLVVLSNSSQSWLCIRITLALQMQCSRLRSSSS